MSIIFFCVTESDWWFDASTFSSQYSPTFKSWNQRACHSCCSTVQEVNELAQSTVTISKPIYDLSGKALRQEKFLPPINIQTLMGRFVQCFQTPLPATWLWLTISNSKPQIADEWLQKTVLYIRQQWGPSS
jgi:hypothetical protein